MSSKPNRVSYVEDANEDTGSVILGTERFAVSEAPSPSPIKERANTGKSRRDKSSRSSSRSPHFPLTDSDSTAQPPTPSSRRERESNEDRMARKTMERQDREREKQDREREKAREKKKIRDKEKQKEREREKEREQREYEKRRSSFRIPSQQKQRHEEKRSQPRPMLHTQTQSQDSYRRPTNLAEDPSYFGISPDMHHPSASPRTRSYHHHQPSPRTSRPPPPSNDQWFAHHPPPAPTPYAMQPQPPPPPPPQPFSSSPYGPNAGGHFPMAHSPMHHQPDYFTGANTLSSNAHLAQRFQERPSSVNSAHGTRSGGSRGHALSNGPSVPPPLPGPTLSSGPSTTYSYDRYDASYDRDRDQHASMARRPSMSKKSRASDEDSRRMPPPPPPRRPSTTAPKSVSFQAPPQHPGPQPLQSKRMSLGSHPFHDDDLRDGDDSLYQEAPFSRAISYSYGEDPRRRRRSSTYDDESYSIEPANRNSRSHSYYGGGGAPRNSGIAYEDKVSYATDYQAKLSGPQLPLTAEALRKANAKRSSDKSSTRSSGSRDESDFRQSNTTRTTRSSGHGEEDFHTMKITGATSVKIGGAEIHCPEGGEINITQGGGEGGGSTGGSDRDGGASLYYGEENTRPRYKKLDNVPYRPRAPSQAASMSRSQYPPTYDLQGGRF